MKDPRRYVKLTTDLPGHVKFEGATPAAKWLAACGIIVAGRDLSDGIIRPAVVIAEAEVPAKHGRELIARGVWHEPGHDCPRCPQPPAGRVIVHDFLEHNSSRDEAEEGRQAMSSGGVAGNHRRWHEARGVVDPGCPLCSSGVSGTRLGGDIGGESHSHSHITSTQVVSRLPVGNACGGLTDDDLDKIARQTSSDRDYARRIAADILDRGEGVRKPLAYVLRAIAAEPERYRRAARVTTATECVRHPGQSATACGPCRVDNLDPSPVPRAQAKGPR